MKKLLLLLMVVPMFGFGQELVKDSNTNSLSLAIGAKYSFDNQSNSWVGIDFSFAHLEPIGESKGFDLEGKEVIFNTIVPRYIEVLVFGYARTITKENFNGPINDFSLDLLRIPAESELPFFGQNFPNLQLNIFKFGFMKGNIDTHNVWYYRPETGFSYGGLSLLYSYNINFKKNEWTRHNKHLITIRFSTRILK